MPTPGAQNALPDFDGDGLPDEWESANGTDPLVADATDDPDADGFINRNEYRAGTNPQDSASYLKLSVRWDNGQVLLTFEAKANRPYRIIFNETLDAALWSQLRDFPAAPADRTESTTDTPPAGSSRFYRLLIP